MRDARNKDPLVYLYTKLRCCSDPTRLVQPVRVGAERRHEQQPGCRGVRQHRQLLQRRRSLRKLQAAHARDDIILQESLLHALLQGAPSL